MTLPLLRPPGHRASLGDLLLPVRVEVTIAGAATGSGLIGAVPRDSSPSRRPDGLSGGAPLLFACSLDDPSPVVAKYSFPAQFRVGCGGRKSRCRSHDDATKVRVEVQRGGRSRPRGARATGVFGQSWSAQVLTGSVFTHRLFRDLTRGQSGALGPRERGVRANRVTRGLVTERFSTVSCCRSKAISPSSVQRGRSASARAAGGTRTASRTSAKVTPPPSTSR